MSALCLIFRGPIAGEPKLHFRPTVLRKGLDPGSGVVPDGVYPNGGSDRLVWRADITVLGRRLIGQQRPPFVIAPNTIDLQVTG
jgi:hypothetical protein